MDAGRDRSRGMEEGVYSNLREFVAEEDAGGKGESKTKGESKGGSRKGERRKSLLTVNK